MKLQKCPQVQNDDFDVDGFCSDLRKKAKYWDSDTVMDEKDFQNVWEKYLFCPCPLESDEYHASNHGMLPNSSMQSSVYKANMTRRQPPSATTMQGQRAPSLLWLPCRLAVVNPLPF